jgi:hypothetical protein
MMINSCEGINDGNVGDKNEMLYTKTDRGKTIELKVPVSRPNGVVIHQEDTTSSPFFPYSVATKKEGGKKRSDWFKKFENLF